jgi:hypothetical protein
MRDFFSPFPSVQAGVVGNAGDLDSLLDGQLRPDSGSTETRGNGVERQVSNEGVVGLSFHEF